MVTVEQMINGRRMWISTDPIRIFNGERILNTGEFVVYYSNQEPDAFFNGALLRDADGNVQRFPNRENAVAAAAQAIEEILAEG